ncbi:SDR family NAD(P)-dependent oxidoreductase [Macrococcus animalis]|uniref:SDR family NAD(P)-dependent oxidoreductase n=1 Tax=Macrococcus animalis TaxID=3395467 RepID=UPI0039BDCDB9
MFNFKNQIVAITGSSSGLGMQMAEGFAELGATVILMARRIEKLEEVKSRIEQKGGKAYPIQLDVTNEKSINKSLQQIIEKFGKVDVLINNAGGSKGGSILEMTNEAWDFTMDLDLTSIFKMTRAYATEMKEKNYGRIINIASMYGMLGTNQQQSAYHASKAGVINFSRAVAAELAPYGVTVNTICPGFFETELTTETLNTKEFQAYCDISVPLKRFGNAGELNSAAIFLAAKESSYVTGITLPVDGGFTAAK